MLESELKSRVLICAYTMCCCRILMVHISVENLCLKGTDVRCYHLIRKSN